MDTWRLCGLAILAVVVFSTVRQMGRDFEVPLRMTAGVIFWGAVVVMARPLTTFVRELTDGGAVGEYAVLAVTAVGISMLCGICADLCRECRETALATAVEAAGRVEILVLCIDPIRDVLEAAEALLSF